MIKPISIFTILVVVLGVAVQILISMLITRCIESLTQSSEPSKNIRNCRCVPKAKHHKHTKYKTTKQTLQILQDPKIQKSKHLKIQQSKNPDFFARFRRCEKVWIFRFLDFWIFAVVHRCLISVMDKSAKCAFPCVVGVVSIYIYIYMYTHTYEYIESV